MLLVSTIEPVYVEIDRVLEEWFEKDTGIRVRHVGADMGATLKIAEKSNIDLVMVHAESLEEKFVKDGHGTERANLMYNDFVIVGPSNDPAGVKCITTVVLVEKDEALLNYITLIPGNPNKF